MGTPRYPAMCVGAAIAAAHSELSALADRYLPAARTACSMACQTFRRAEAAAEQARSAVWLVEHYDTRAALLRELVALDTEIDGIRPDLDDVARVTERSW